MGMKKYKIANVTKCWMEEACEDLLWSKIIFLSERYLGTGMLKVKSAGPSGVTKVKGEGAQRALSVQRPWRLEEQGGEMRGGPIQAWLCRS